MGCVDDRQGGAGRRSAFGRGRGTSAETESESVLVGIWVEHVDGKEWRRVGG